MAAQAAAPPMDEIQWRSVDWLQAMGGLHSNSVLPYFSKSPFFDPTSNNAVIENQAIYNQQMAYIIATRENFEGHLRTMAGLEFIVAQEPAETTPGAGTGVWVIRKQTRRKNPGEEDQITVHGTYFVMGENIYQAPAVSDIVGSRLLHISTSLDKFISGANAVANFSPALGHTYLPPTSSRSKIPEPQGAGQSSRQSTPLPGGLPSAQKPTVGMNSNSYMDQRLLDESFHLSLRYGDEYMDENPITGHPGAFNLSSTGRGKDAVSLQKVAAQNQAKAAAAAGEPEKPEVIPPTRKGSKADKSGKSGVPKIKRKKSKSAVPKSPAA